VTGGFAATDGGFDPLGRALALCRDAGIACAPYAVDDQVVWTGAKETAKEYARIVRSGQTSTLNFAFAVNPDCTTRGLAKLRVSETPQHGTATVLTLDGHPDFPPGSSFANCNVASVPGVAVTYAPSPGFVGSDVVAFEETSVDGVRRLFRIILTVQ